MNLEVTSVSMWETIIKEQFLHNFLFRDISSPEATTQIPALWRTAWPADKISWLEITPNYEIQEGIEKQCRQQTVKTAQGETEAK